MVELARRTIREGQGGTSPGASPAQTIAAPRQPAERPIHTIRRTASGMTVESWVPRGRFSRAGRASAGPPTIVQQSRTGSKGSRLGRRAAQALHWALRVARIEYGRARLRPSLFLVPARTEPRPPDGTEAIVGRVIGEGRSLAEIQFRRVTKQFTSGVPVLDGIDLAIAPTGTAGRPWSVGFGKDDAPSTAGGAGIARFGRHLDGWARRDEARLASSRRGDGLPEPGTLSPSDGLRQHRVRAGAGASTGTRCGSV